MVNREIKIAPSVLSADFSKMGEEIKSLEACGADVIHVDVMDGMFVPNITFGMKMVADVRKITALPLDVHLMIVEPWRYVESFAAAGADIITVHQEACGERLEETLKLIKSFGKKCGAVINPDTPASKISKVITLCDMVVLMSVFPGKGGQKFIEGVLDKVEEIYKIADKSEKIIDLEIDGGVNLNNCKKIKDSGVNVLVAGNTVFSAADRKVVIEKLRNE